MRHAAEVLDDLIEARQNALRHTLFEHQGVRYVVDVFRGAAKVDEFGDAHDFSVICTALFEPVFNGFNVVVGAPLDGFDGGRIIH